MELDPNWADAYAHRGLILAERGSYSQAIADFDRALALNPRLANTWANRGLVFLMQGRLDEAELDLARCRDLGGKINPAVEKLLQQAREKTKKD
jgi:tetratricopeptide (TPR) repeat protein